MEQTPFEFEAQPLPEEEQTTGRLQKAQEELLEKWERKDGEGTSPWARLAWFFVGVALFGLAIWNLSLQRQVRQFKAGQRPLSASGLRVGGKEAAKEPLKGEQAPKRPLFAGPPEGEADKEKGAPLARQAPKGSAPTANLPPFPLPFFEPPKEAAQPSSPPSFLSRSSLSSVPPPTEIQKPMPLPSIPSPSPPMSPLTGSWQGEGEQVQLIGIVIGEGERLAVLKLPNGRTVTVGKGEKIPTMNWSVISVEPIGVTLSQKDEPKRKLVLRFGF